VEILKVQLGRNATNCYVIQGKTEGIIIDPGSKKEADKILGRMDLDSFEYRYIVNTHGHFDHIGANQALQDKTGADIAIHYDEADALEDPDLNSSSLLGTEVISPPADLLLEEGDVIEFSGGKLEVYHTPGHSPGGIVLYEHSEGVLFSGDTIFRSGVGRTDLPRGSGEELKASLERIKELFPGDVKVYPGHGRATTLQTFYEGVFPKIY